MCQASVYLDGKEIMRDVLLVESLSEGVRLTALFEPARVVTATLRQIDLIKHRVILDSLKGATEAMNELDKLRVLIPHWIEHNREHAEEFRRWAEQAGDVSADILAAAEALVHAGLNRPTVSRSRWVCDPAAHASGARVTDPLGAVSKHSLACPGHWVI